MTGTHTGSRTPGLESTDSDSSITSSAQEAAGTAADTAKEKGSELQQKASEQVGNVATKVADKADTRRTELAEQARTLQEKAQQFATSITEEQPQIGHALEQVVDSANRLISYVEETPVEQMTQDVSTQMRQHPLLFAAGMFGAGFALTRAFKPVDRSSLTSGSSPRQLETTSTATTPAATTPVNDLTTTQPLPAASALDGGMH